mmetsp:Transcript_91018/g.282852  ORF Transcript_91018/g.282852 Transcript_91018/m.282852 type:complete len:1016 (+) Transcript_91018:107-3154(+)
MLSRRLEKRQREAEEGKTGADEGAFQPPRKLAQRTALVATQKPPVEIRVRESALFRPVRAIGVVTDGTPLTLATLGEADFVTAAVGRGFLVFDCKRLRLARVGPRLNEKVRAVAAVGEVVLTALKADIVAWHRLLELGRFRGHTGTATVMCTLGTAYLISASGSEVLVWQLSAVGLDSAAATASANSVSSPPVLTPLGKLAIDAKFGECTAACHPPTYLNKVLLAGTSGCLELWNTRTRERVHAFQAHMAGGRASSGITCMREAPNVLDLVALGFASGRICVLNAREDRVVVELDQAQGRVTALTFRSGASAPAHLISGTPVGAFVVWDLDKRRAHHVHEGVHQGPITSAHFLPDQPLMVTGGRDNAIRIWIFDTPDGLPRLLRSRCGCPGPAHRMGFYSSDADRELIVAGGCDGSGFVSKISFVADHQNSEYSQSALAKMPCWMTNLQPTFLGRLPPVIDLAFCQARHFDWPAIVTAHERMDAAMLWSAFNQALAPKALKPPPEVGLAPVSAVAISACGNYCVIGLENGALHRFNLQSQLHRGPIPKPQEFPEEPEAEAKVRASASPISAASRAHRGRVCGLAITVAGKVVSVSSHPGDCQLKLWALKTHEALGAVALGSSRPGCPSCLLLRMHGSLLAVSLDDGALLVVDLHGESVVRCFDCGVPATDVSFSGDGRWLAAALRDGGLRIFDLPSARCVDAFVFAKPALSVCFSPSTAFLLTSHAKGNAIQTWANKFLFDPSLSAPLLQPEPEAPTRVDEPGVEVLTEDEAPADEGSENKQGHAGIVPLKGEQVHLVATKPLEPELLTLSDVPPQKWLATLHLDLVKERNKAAEPPKPLPNAPFFLPTVHDGVTPRFAAPLSAAEGEEEAVDAASLSRIFKGKEALARGSQFQSLLRKADYDGALAFLKAQTPSGVHLAIEGLGPLGGGDEGELEAGLRLFLHHLARAHYADEVQAYMSLFLQAHGEELAESPELRALCAELSNVQESLWTSLSTKCHKVRCFLGMLTQTQSQW